MDYQFHGHTSIYIMIPDIEILQFGVELHRALNKQVNVSAAGLYMLRFNYCRSLLQFQQTAQSKQEGLELALHLLYKWRISLYYQNVKKRLEIFPLKRMKTLLYSLSSDTYTPRASHGAHLIHTHTLSVIPDMFTQTKLDLTAETLGVLSLPEDRPPSYIPTPPPPIHQCPPEPCEGSI